MAEVTKYFALKSMTIEGGQQVSPGDEIPGEIGSRFGSHWFEQGYIEKKVLIVEDPKPKPKAEPKEEVVPRKSAARAPKGGATK